MKLCRYNDQRLGLISGEQVIDVSEGIAAAGEWRWPLPPGDRLIAALDAVRASVEEHRKWGFVQLHRSVALLSPVANPTKIVVARTDGSAHGDERGLFLGNPVPAGPGEGAAALPDRPTDCEIAPAIVVGRTARVIEEADALDHVAGYAIALRTTARGRGEAVDDRAVIGPWLATADEIADPDALALRVNGETRRDTTGARRSRGCRRLIASASRRYTLYPGDVVVGAPEISRPVQPGNIVRCEIEGIGAMEVAVRAAG